MIRDLGDKRKKELLLFSNMMVTIEFLPQIMKKLKEENKDKGIDEITTEIINSSEIELSQSNEIRLKSILRSASIKGKEYKDFKFLLIHRYKKEHIKKRKSYQFTSPIELFFALNKTLLKTLYVKIINGTEIVNEREKEPITAEKKRIITEYINNIFSEQEKQIVRRKK